MSNHEMSMPLSERELQVLGMVATGASNQQIARELVISVNTVKVHLRNIFEKLEVQSRTEATLRAIQEGWVVVSEDDVQATEGATLAAPKTYLLATNGPVTLAQWQQIYLVIALLLALATVLTPLYLKEVSSIGPYVPPIFKENGERLYQQQPTPPPIGPSNDSSNRWVFQDPMPTRRAGLGIVAFEGQVFAIGGVRDNDRATRSVEIYHPTTGTWVEGTGKPTATTDVSAVVLDDKIYVPGGCTNEGRAIDVLEIYNPKTDKWTQGKALPEARCGYGLVALKDNLYIFGGWDGEAFVDTVLVFSAKEDEWAVMDSRIPKKIGYVGAANLDNTIYVVGGYNGQEEFNHTYVFVPETGEWIEKSPMQEKRGGLGLISTANQLYAIGGGWQHALETSEKYNPTSDTWSTFETPFTNEWRNLGLAAVGTKIYAVGGWDATQEEYMDVVVSYEAVFHVFLPITLR